MSEFNFDLKQRKHQEIWRKTNISTSERETSLYDV